MALLTGDKRSRGSLEVQEQMNKGSQCDHRLAEFGLDSVQGGASPSIFRLAETVPSPLRIFVASITQRNGLNWRRSSGVSTMGRCAGGWRCPSTKESSWHSRNSIAASRSGRPFAHTMLIRSAAMYLARMRCEQLAKIESGQRPVLDYELAAIARALKVPIQELFE